MCICNDIVIKDYICNIISIINTDADQDYDSYHNNIIKGNTITTTKADGKHTNRLDYYMEIMCFKDILLLKSNKQPKYANDFSVKVMQMNRTS